MFRLNVFKDPFELSQALAARITSLITDILRHQQEFYLAISGGNTPRMLFNELVGSYSGFPSWDRVQFFWTDERCVAPDHEDSNYRMVNENMLVQLNISADRIHRMKGEAVPLQEAERYGMILDSLLPRQDAWPVFDLILLGMGNDGHIASIFPDRTDLFQSDTNCAVAIHPLSGQKRITLAGQVINHARNIFFMVTGENKAEMTAKVLEKEGIISIPASMVKPVQGNLEWFIDQSAARFLVK